MCIFHEGHVCRLSGHSTDLRKSLALVTPVGARLPHDRHWLFDSGRHADAHHLHNQIHQVAMNAGHVLTSEQLSPCQKNAWQI
jgi:hypothetical protein